MPSMRCTPSLMSPKQVFRNGALKVRKKISINHGGHGEEY